MIEQFSACKRLMCTYEVDIIKNQGISKGIKDRPLVLASSENNLLLVIHEKNTAI